VADLLGFSLWIGVVVVVFVQIWPEVKRRQYKQALDAYEAAAGRQARAGSGQAPDPGERRGSPPGATGMTAATSRDAGPRKGAARRPLGGPYRRTRRRPERHRDDADPDGHSKLELTKYHPRGGRRQAGEPAAQHAEPALRHVRRRLTRACRGTAAEP